MQQYPQQQTSYTPEIPRVNNETPLHREVNSHTERSEYIPLSNSEYPAGYRPQVQQVMPTPPVQWVPVYVPNPSSSPYNSSERLFAAFSYVFGWFSGLIALLFVRESRFVRFHALQSFLFFGLITLLNIGGMFVFYSLDRFHFPGYGITIMWGFFVFMILNFVAFVGWLVGMVQASLGKTYRMPFIGNMAAHATLQQVMPKSERDSNMIH